MAEHQTANVPHPTFGTAGAVGGPGFLMFAKSMGWHLPAWAIIIIGIFSILALLYAGIGYAIWVVNWIRRHKGFSAAAIYLREAAKRDAIPLMIGAASSAGILLIGAVVFVAVHSNGEQAAPQKQSGPPPAAGADQAPQRPTLPHATYNERQIREMLDALTQAQSLVEKTLMPLWNPIQNRLINPMYLLTSVGKKLTIEGLVDSRNTLQNYIWPLVDSFVYKDHREYQAQMRIAMALDQNAPKGELARTIQIIIDRLQMFPDEPDKLDPKSIGLVQDDYEKAAQQNQMLWNWLVTAQARIKEMQANLRDKGVTGYEAP